MRAKPSTCVPAARCGGSTYAGIVRLVEEAQRSKAPMSRLADRYSLLFLVVTVALATAAWWLTGDPIRAVAVLVVATPCPLILAVPVALVAGLSRAAHFGVLIKGAKPSKRSHRSRTLILDKTGTLTDGRPQIVSIDSTCRPEPRRGALPGRGARPGVEAPYGAGDRCRGTRARHGPASADGYRGSSGRGRRRRRVDGRSVVVGGTRFRDAPDRSTRDSRRDPEQGSGRSSPSPWTAGSPDIWSWPTHCVRGTADFLAGVRRQGIGRILLATGDRRAVARAVTDGLGLDASVPS